MARLRRRRSLEKVCRVAKCDRLPRANDTKLDTNKKRFRRLQLGSDSESYVSKCTLTPSIGVLPPILLLCCSPQTQKRSTFRKKEVEWRSKLLRFVTVTNNVATGRGSKSCVFIQEVATHSESSRAESLLFVAFRSVFRANVVCTLFKHLVIMSKHWRTFCKTTNRNGF